MVRVLFIIIGSLLFLAGLGTYLPLNLDLRDSGESPLDFITSENARLTAIAWALMASGSGIAVFSVVYGRKSETNQ